ncbi:MAG: hypothetical protein R3190_16890, partial [Thermoanaerobaculia bacterium]|nr:hypothetical protein [Thermoanaerobaculia bacterium]
GILPALESAHAVAEAMRHAPRLGEDRIILVNLSGRGDKDVESVLEYDAALAARTAGSVESGAAASSASVTVHPSAAALDDRGEES